LTVRNSNNGAGSKTPLLNEAYLEQDSLFPQHAGTAAIALGSTSMSASVWLLCSLTLRLSRKGNPSIFRAPATEHLQPQHHPLHYTSRVYLRRFLTASSFTPTKTSRIQNHNSIYNRNNHNSIHNPQASKASTATTATKAKH
jgi:hypothetical protein